jgi:hypothetical protein
VFGVDVTPIPRPDTRFVDGLPTPCRVRAGFRRLRGGLGTPAGAAKTVRAGSGWPLGRRNAPKPGQAVYNKSDIALMAGLARSAPPP